MVKSKKCLLAFTILIASLSVSFLGLTVRAEDSGLPSFDTITEYRDSNRYTLTDDLSKAVNLQTVDPSWNSFNTSLGNIYYDASSLALKFYNKNGYLWSTTVSSGGLNKVNQKKADSAIQITYYDETGKAYEENLLSSASTIVQIEKSVDLLKANVTFGTSGISLFINYHFSDSGLTIDIPYDSIKEGTYTLGSISLYSYLGSVREDYLSGYVMIPDGVGALVRFQKSNSNLQTSYAKEFYGRDLTYLSNANLASAYKDGANLTIPVYGIVHGINENAIFANIISGSEYGILSVHYPGESNLPYTNVYPSFVYRKKYTQVLDQAGNTIYLLQAKPNIFDISVSYSLLEGEEANYVGMANAYSDYLETKGMKKIAKSGDSPLLLETIGLEISKGDFFANRSVMTTFRDFENMAKELKDAGISNLTGLYEGYTAKGYSYESPTYNSFSSSLGSKSSLSDLKAAYNELYFAMDVTKASDKGSGYSTYNDFAKKISMQTYSYSEFDVDSHLLTVDKSVELYEKNVKALRKLGVSSFALMSGSSLLYADYNEQTTRTDMIKAYQEITKDKAGLFAPNAYLYQSLNAYFDSDLYSSQYLGFTDTVPFLTIALSPYTEIYATSANFYANAKDELLRVIDFGVNLSFVVTNASSSEFLKTPLEYVYSSKFSALKEAIVIYYNFVNEALKEVRGSSLVSRTVIASGIVKDTYLSGKSLIINYTERDFDYQGLTVKAKGYEVIR